MTIYNLGSINIDYIYTLPHLVRAGETLAATQTQSALGGKGANQSIAIARAGGQVCHGGMINQADASWLDQMRAAGVNLEHILYGDTATGHAIVAVDQASGENQIILSPSSNANIPDDLTKKLLADAKEGDWALAQNETNQTVGFLKAAKAKGLSICYSAAPFLADITAELLPLVDLLIVNEGEFQDLKNHVGHDDWGLDHLIVTKGAAGAEYQGIDGAFKITAHHVNAIDTTGAGDTYLGYVLAGLDQGNPIKDVMALAGKAAALQVTRLGASTAIPTLSDVLNHHFEEGA